MGMFDLLDVIEQIPADKKLVMTPVLHRGFLAAGCDPHCHCCRTGIVNGDTFWLAFIETIDAEAIGNYKEKGTDHMLCDTCTKVDYIHGVTRVWDEHNDELMAYQERQRHKGFSRPHKEIS